MSPQTFFVAGPQVTMLINAIRSFRMGFGEGSRFIGGAGLLNSKLRGISAIIMLVLLFGCRWVCAEHLVGIAVNSMDQTKRESARTPMELKRVIARLVRSRLHPHCAGRLSRATGRRGRHST